MRIPRILRIFLWFIGALIVLLGIASLALIYVPEPVERWLQDKVLVALQQRYGPDIQLKNLHVQIVPVFRVTGDEFRLPNRGDNDLPPFITINRFTAQALPLELLRKPVHLSWVKLEGLVIHVPPKRDKPPEGATAAPKRHTRLANFVIDRVDADGTDLFVLPKKAGGAPMEWELHSLHLTSAGIGQAMRFTAELTNPKPPGLIRTTGSFGPWNMDDPSETAVSGHYEFYNADLAIFNGIAGILSSVGDYTGVLENIIVDGTTDTPDFKLDSGAQAVHLTTKYHAIVDGTNGNTYLQPVDAHFLNSSVTAKGMVASQPGDKGKTISLDIDVHDAKVQDMLNLAAASKQPMLTGAVATKAKLLIPPGKQTVLRKIQLAGTFHLQGARFGGDANDTVAALSRRAQGKPNDQTIQSVDAELLGDFDLRNTALKFSKLQFLIPGVDAQVRGSYGLESGALDFTGEVRLQAHVSQTMTGVNRVLLKPVDPLLARHGAGTYLPVNVKGTREKPQIKLDLGKIF
jgi:hypothetical protein